MLLLLAQLLRLLGPNAGAEQEGADPGQPRRRRGDGGVVLFGLVLVVVVIAINVPDLKQFIGM